MFLIMNLRKCEVKAGELVLPIRNCYSLPFVSKSTRWVFNKDAVRCTFSAVCKDSVRREAIQRHRENPEIWNWSERINAEALSRACRREVRTHSVLVESLMRLAKARSRASVSVKVLP